MALCTLGFENLSSLSNVSHGNLPRIGDVRIMSDAERYDSVVLREEEMPPNLRIEFATPLGKFGNPFMRKVTVMPYYAKSLLLRWGRALLAIYY